MSPFEDKTEYLVIGTPKACSKLDAIEDKLPKNYTIEATDWVYMNMLDGSWTADDCDNVLYIVPKTALNRRLDEFKFEMSEFS